MNLETGKPGLKPEVMRRDEREKKGAGFLPFLLSKLGLGGAGSGGVLGGAGGFGGGLLASKAGMMALVLAGSTVAAGIGMFTSSGPRAVKRIQGNMSGLGFLPKAEPEGGAGSVSAGADAPAAKGGASQSLDYFAKGNPPAVETAADQAVSDAASSPSSDSSAEASQAPAQESRAATHFNSAPPMPKPQLVRSQSSLNGASGGGGGGGFSQVAQAPHPGLAGSISGKSSGGAMRSMSSNTRMGMSGVGGGRASGRSAAQQLANTRRAVAGNLRSGQVSSAGSGTTYDGGLSPTGNVGPAAGKAGAGLSQGSGGEGLNTARSTSKDLKEISPPPPTTEKENQTPYQKQIYMAIGALAVGMIALMLATHFANKAKTTPPPANAGLWTAAQALAGVATAAGAAAAMIGLTIMTKYKQQMQGIMFMASGGILSFQAAKALMDSFSDKEAQEKIAAKDVASHEAARNALGVKAGDGVTVTKMADGSYAKFGADGKMIGDPVNVTPTAKGDGFVSGKQLFDAKGNPIQGAK